MVNEVAYQSDAITLHGLLLRIGCVAQIGSVVPLLDALVLVFRLFDLVERDIPADGETEGFDTVDLIPMVTFVPDLYHRFLHNILCLRSVESDTEGEPEEFILQWQHVVPETDFFHPL
jgi:hypothetical protein